MINEKFRIYVRLISILMLLSGLVLNLTTALAAPATQSDTHTVYILQFQGAVTPVLQKYIEDGIDAAFESGAEAVVLQLDTPGGSVDITNQITQVMLASPVPVVIYVAPAGAHAGSAGTFITLAGHVAAMAPGSSIGAASPVDGSGGDIGETMEAKVENILSADIENLAERRGEEAVAWAIAAVREAEAATANRALELGVIDYIASDVPDLLAQMDGHLVTVRGEESTLNTADALVVPLDLNPIQQFLNFIANPTVATILLTIGSAGLLAEVWNPGAWIPGIIGVTSLLLGLYALGQLDANFAGLGLILLAIALFVAEAFTPTFGALVAGGVVIFVLGSALLFDAPGVDIPWVAITTLAVALGGFTLLASTFGLAAQRRPAMGGEEAIIGHTATAREAFGVGERGKVFIFGEWWNAKLEAGTLEPGDEAEVVGRDGYTLLVRGKGS